MRALWPQLVGLRTGGARLRFRMDGAFFRQDVLRWLQGRGVGYAIKVPFYRWLDGLSLRRLMRLQQPHPAHRIYPYLLHGCYLHPPAAGAFCTWSS